MSQAKQKLLIILPGALRWAKELECQLSTLFDLQFLDLQIMAPKSPEECLVAAVKCSNLINQTIRKFKPNGIYVSCEFAWDVFLQPEFTIPFDPNRVLFMLWDDVLFHEKNLSVLEAHSISRIFIADKIGELVYRRMGYEATFCPLEGSNQHYFPSPTGSTRYQVSFFGQLNKADRRNFVEQISIRNPVKIFGQQNYDDNKHLFYAQLCDEIRSSQLILNFSKSSQQHNPRIFYQFKGRILEALFCGVLPITEFCPATKLLFENLVPQFDNVDEACDLVEELLKDQKKRCFLAKEASLLAERYRPEKIYKEIEL